MKTSVQWVLFEYKKRQTKMLSKKFKTKKYPATYLSCRLNNGLDSGKLSVYVRLKTRSTRMKHATLPSTDTTGGTRNGRYLHSREFPLLHCDRIQ